jgi:hypothetical protein
MKYYAHKQAKSLQATKIFGACCKPFPAWDKPERKHIYRHLLVIVVRVLAQCSGNTENGKA